MAWPAVAFFGATYPGMRACKFEPGLHERGLPSSSPAKELCPQKMRYAAHVLLCSNKFPM